MSNDLDGWEYALQADEVEEEDVMPAIVDGQVVAIYRVKGEYYASEDRCTHGDASLSEGVVVGDVIECPLHQGRFCVRDGKALSAPVAEDIKTYPTKVDNGMVFIQLVDPA